MHPTVYTYYAFSSVFRPFSDYIVKQASFDTEPAISNWRGIPSARFVMSDYRRCRWPEPLRDDDESIARFFDGEADALLVDLCTSL